MSIVEIWYLKDNSFSTNCGQIRIKSIALDHNYNAMTKH